MEWSGRIFYKIIKGTIKDPKNLKLEAVDVYLEDKGSSAYTEYESQEDIMDLFEHNPQLEDCRAGMIHSHNSMGVFFSGTDMKELEDNHDKYEVYLSVIVNNAGEYKAKCAFPGKRIVNVDTKISFKFLGKEIKVANKTDSDKEEDVMFVFDVNVILPEEASVTDEFFIKRVEEVIEAKEKAKYKHSAYTAYSRNYNEHVLHANIPGIYKSPEPSPWGESDNRYSNPELISPSLDYEPDTDYLEPSRIEIIRLAVKLLSDKREFYSASKPGQLRALIYNIAKPNNDNAIVSKLRMRFNNLSTCIYETFGAKKAKDAGFMFLVLDELHTLITDEAESFLTDTNFSTIFADFIDQSMDITELHFKDDGQDNKELYM